MHKKKDPTMKASPFCKKTSGSRVPDLTEELNFGGG